MCTRSLGKEGSQQPNPVRVVQKGPAPTPFPSPVNIWPSSSNKATALSATTYSCTELSFQAGWRGLQTLQQSPWTVTKNSKWTTRRLRFPVWESTPSLGAGCCRLVWLGILKLEKLKTLDTFVSFNQEYYKSGWPETKVHDTHWSYSEHLRKHYLSFHFLNLSFLDTDNQKPQITTFTSFPDIATNPTKRFKVWPPGQVKLTINLRMDSISLSCKTPKPLWEIYQNYHNKKWTQNISVRARKD